MKITIKESGLTLSVQVDVPSTDPSPCSYAVMQASSFWHNYSPKRDWALARSDEGTQVMSHELTGPFVGDAVINWLNRLPTDIAFLVEFERLSALGDKSVKVDRDALTPYPVEVVFNDKALKGIPELTRMLRKPDAAHELGTFGLSCGEMRVTDPCYTKDTWCTGTFKALNGTWKAWTYLGDSAWGGVRVHQLRVAHSSVPAGTFNRLERFASLGIEAGVDSGQCGFFDDVRFPDDSDEFEYGDNSFYGRCCELTLDNSLPGGGVIPDGFGAVSSSGYGDGGYDVKALRNAQGQVIAAYIEFISDGESDAEAVDDEAELQD